MFKEVAIFGPTHWNHSFGTSFPHAMIPTSYHDIHITNHWSKETRFLVYIPSQMNETRFRSLIARNGCFINEVEAGSSEEPEIQNYYWTELSHSDLNTTRLEKLIYLFLKRHAAAP